eukprot:2009334-Amphidinium_carterae.1
MTKYLETAKIKKHSETLGLHPHLGNHSLNMITRGQLRPRGSYSTTRPRRTTPQPRQRLQVYREEDGSTNNDFFHNATKVEEIDDLTGQQYFAEEAAREDDINYNDQQTANID